MTDPNAELLNPATSAERLSQLAASNPELGAQIAAHPNAYPALQEWIATYAQAAVVQQPQQPQQPAYQPAETAAQATTPVDPFGSSPTVPVDPFAASPTAVTTPLDPYGAVAYTPTAVAPGEASPKPPRRKGLIIGLSIGVAAVLVLGGVGGGLWWYFGSKLGGAATPEAAVDKALDGFVTLDPITIYGSFAPSEVSGMRSSFEAAISASAPNDEVDYQGTIQELKDSLSITTEDFTYETEEIAESVARVNILTGTLTVDGDEERVGDAIFALTEASIRTTYEGYGYSDSEIEEELASERERLAEQMDFPYTVDLADYKEAAGIEAGVITVHENGGWYISPLMSSADQAYRLAEGSGGDLQALGDKIIEAKPSANPESALIATIEAALDGTIEDVAATLPLPERRLLSIYGPTVEDMYSQVTADFSVEMTARDLTSEISDGLGRINLEELAFEWESFSETYDLTLSGVCAEASADSSNQEYCLTDIPQLDKLGAADFRLVAVQEGGGWLFSPLTTVSDVVRIITKNYLEYYNEGKLDELYEN